MDFDKFEREIAARDRGAAAADAVRQRTLDARGLASSRAKEQLQETVQFLERKSPPDFVLRRTPGKVNWRTPRATPMGDGWRLNGFHGYVLMETGVLFVSSYFCRFGDMPRTAWNKDMYDAASRHEIPADTHIVGVNSKTQPWTTEAIDIVPLPVPDDRSPADYYFNILAIEGAGDGLTLGTFPDGTPAVIEKDSDGYHRVQSFEGMLTGAVRSRLEI